MVNVLPKSAADPDPLAHLHKMSATAGAAITQYVAINGLSIAALLLGIASVLAILINALWIVPVVGIILGLLSLRQINRSNGTQSGKLPAYLGLLLCVVMGGIAGARQIVDSIRAKARTEQVLATLTQFSNGIATDDFAAAYQAFSPEFQSRIPEPQFIARWKDLEQRDFSKIRAIRWNQVPPLFSDDVSGQIPTADLEALVEFAQGFELRVVLHFRERNGAWRIYDLPAFFQGERHF